MPERAGIDGLETVLAGFWKVKGSTAASAERALKRGALFLLAASKELVPVEYGNLKASGFVASTGTGFSTKVSVGYTAAYAIYVHELVGMKLKGQRRISKIGVYWGPTGQAKFLEGPARALKPQILQTIYGEFQT